MKILKNQKIKALREKVTLQKALILPFQLKAIKGGIVVDDAEGI